MPLKTLGGGYATGREMNAGEKQHCVFADYWRTFFTPRHNHTN